MKGNVSPFAQVSLFFLGK